MMCKDEARVKLDFARHLEAVFCVEGVKLAAVELNCDGPRRRAAGCSSSTKTQ
jgi:hypothetical protein